MTLLPEDDAEAFLPNAFLYGTAVGAVGYLLFTWISHMLLRFVATTNLRTRVKALPSKDQINFHTLTPSFAHAVAQIVGTYAIFVGYSESHSSEPVEYFDDQPNGPAFHMGVFVGYLLADFAYLGPTLLGSTYTIHHLSAAACWTMCAHWRTMQWYASMLQFAEFSTLFLNVRQVVLTSGYDSGSPAAMWSSLGLFVSFGAVRVWPLPKIMYMWVGRDVWVFRDAHGTVAAAICSVFFAIHFCLQTAWFGMMLKKLMKVVLGGGGGGKTKKKKE